MSEEAFMLMSLKESKAKRLAQVIGNDTSRSILEFLSRKEGSETEISQTLNIPISTVHYNLKHLVDNGLVLAEEFHYSSKGREIVHYKLANKLIIIAPKDVDKTSLMDSLKTILPISALIAGGALLAKIFGSGLRGSSTFGVSKMMDTASVQTAVSEADAVVSASTPASASNVGSASADIVTSKISEAAQSVQSSQATQVAASPDSLANASRSVSNSYHLASSGLPPWVWFLIGAVFAILAVLIVVWFRKRQKS